MSAALLPISALLAVNRSIVLGTECHEVFWIDFVVGFSGGVFHEFTPCQV